MPKLLIRSRLAEAKRETARLGHFESVAKETGKFAFKPKRKEPQTRKKPESEAAGFFKWVSGRLEDMLHRLYD